MWPVPTGCPQRKEVGRWWASWASRPSSAGQGDQAGCLLASDTVPAFPRPPLGLSPLFPRGSQHLSQALGDTEELPSLAVCCCRASVRGRGSLWHRNYRPGSVPALPPQGQASGELGFRLL